MNDSDLSRIKAFRQLKREIRGSDRHLIVGVPYPSRRDLRHPQLSSLHRGFRPAALPRVFPNSSYALIRNFVSNQKMVRYQRRP
jgi:hypothetical protein